MPKSPWLSSSAGSYFDHLNVKGYNALGIYSGVNCWMRQVWGGGRVCMFQVCRSMLLIAWVWLLQIRVVNADNAFIVNGADFVTVTDVQTDITKTRLALACCTRRAGKICRRGLQHGRTDASDLTSC